MAKRRKKVKVVEKLLGRERAWGTSTAGDEIIEIDPRLKPKRYFQVLLHEGLHLAYHDLPEREVERGSKVLIDILWDQKYRKILE